MKLYVAKCVRILLRSLLQRTPNKLYNQVSTFHQRLSACMVWGNLTFHGQNCYSQNSFTCVYCCVSQRPVWWRLEPQLGCLEEVEPSGRPSGHWRWTLEMDCRMTLSSLFRFLTVKWTVLLCHGLPAMMVCLLPSSNAVKSTGHGWNLHNYEPKINLFSL
jgi:hypothetical protein